MSKIKSFFIGLSKSTKITMIACGCFIFLTLLILTFFVMFPITPSESTVSKISSEGLVYRDEVTSTTVAETTTETTTTTIVTTTVAVTTEPETETEIETTATNQQESVYTTVSEPDWEEDDISTDYYQYEEDYEETVEPPVEDTYVYGEYGGNEYGDPVESTEYGDWVDWEDATESEAPAEESPTSIPDEIATEESESVQPATSPVIIEPSAASPDDTTIVADDVPYL